MKVKPIKIGNVYIGKRIPVVIAGPCVVESRSLCLEVCRFLRKVTEKLGIGYIFKASFDKANRTSINSFRGIGKKKGLEILKFIREKFSVPVLSDIHEPQQAEEVKDVLDVIQIPAFLSRQTDLLIEAARTGKVINVKKGQFLSPEEMRFVIEKIERTGNRKILLTERGTFFGYNNLVVDFRSLRVMRKFGYPVIFDGTHSVQHPAGGGGVSSGDRHFVPPLCRAAVACGCDALFLEVHPQPDRALSDGPNMLDFKMAEKVLKEMVKVWHAIRE